MSNSSVRIIFNSDEHDDNGKENDGDHDDGDGIRGGIGDSDSHS